MNLLKSFYLSYRAFTVLGVCVLLFCCGIVFRPFFVAGQMLLLLLCLGILVESILLFSTQELLSLQRILPYRLSNGDDNVISLKLQNHTNRAFRLTIREDLPFQLQLRSWTIGTKLPAAATQITEYSVRPTMRGKYYWKHTHVLCGLELLGLVERKVIFEANDAVACFPSFIQFQKLPIKAMVASYTQAANNYIRKIGQSLEFEQIKEYVRGDNYRHINWKASAKQGRQMVNQYQEERSQDIYAVIDLGRAMKMPFEQQTLLDYAINGSIALSKAIVEVKDRAGLITFSAQKCTLVPARSEYKQFGVINDHLYALESDFGESDFEKLYKFVRFKLQHRSLLVIYTNFDSINALKRNLEYLKAIAKYHLVLVVFFENTEIASFVETPANNLREVYTKTIGKQFLSQNQLIIKELHKEGILALVTAPKLLSVKTINKYINIKQKQII